MSDVGRLADAARRGEVLDLSRRRSSRAPGLPGVVLRTSGRTGSQKRVLVSWEALAARAASAAEALEIAAPDVALALLAPYRTPEVYSPLGAAIDAGGRAYLPADMLPGEGAGAAVDRLGATILLVNAAAAIGEEFWLDPRPEGGTLRCVLLSDSPTVDYVRRKAAAWAGVEPTVWYGSRETGGVCCQTGRAPPGCVGSPLPGVDVDVARDGRVLVAGPGLADGYVDDDGSVAPISSPHATGDRGRVDGEGRLVLELPRPPRDRRGLR